MAEVLIIDDDEFTCTMLAEMVRRLGHRADYVLTLKEGLTKSASRRFEVVFLDVNLPDGNSLHSIPRFRGNSPGPEVIIITGAGDPEGAELAIRNGAWDYLEKPLSPSNALLPLSRVLSYRESLKQVQRPSSVLKLEGIIGSSPGIRASLDALTRAANSEANVLLTGETGTGKELFARAIHRNGPRKDRNFVVVDCASLPETLIQSTLFGHEKGAYTGAERARDGLIKQADGGTLFLDEVGEMSLSVQKSFLRVLQERKFRPIGAKEEIKSNFRLIAATNRNLDQMAEEGQFRKDLLYRLKTTVVELPSLRERVEDIEELVRHYTSKICEKYGMELKSFSPDFFDVLVKYDWPGNVRELIHAVESAVMEARYEPLLFPKHLPEHIRVTLARAKVRRAHFPERRKVDERPGSVPPGIHPLSGFQAFREGVLDEAEKRYFEDLMLMTNGDIKKACGISGLGRSRLYSLMKKHGISRSALLSSQGPVWMSISNG